MSMFYDIDASRSITAFLIDILLSLLNLLSGRNFRRRLQFDFCDSALAPLCGANQLTTNLRLAEGRFIRFVRYMALVRGSFLFQALEWPL